MQLVHCEAAGLPARVGYWKYFMPMIMGLHHPSICSQAKLKILKIFSADTRNPKSRIKYFYAFSRRTPNF